MPNQVRNTSASGMELSAVLVPVRPTHRGNLSADPEHRGHDARFLDAGRTFHGGRGALRPVDTDDTM
ncbi:MAG: hypothetical protein ACKOFA_06175, partial [Rhodoluna sp.]